MFRPHENMDVGLPDLVREELQVLFVGYNPSLRSAELGHHYAGRSNRFWALLFEAGLTPVKLSFKEDYKLLDYGYGLTNIVHRPTKEAAEITKKEYQAGALSLTKLIEKYKPKVVCYVGIGVYKAFAGKKKIDWGLQEEGLVDGVIDFVAPSSSGLNRMPIKRQVEIYAELKQILLNTGQNRS